jgi:hypothetical protein
MNTHTHGSLIVSLAAILAAAGSALAQNEKLEGGLDQPLQGAWHRATHATIIENSDGDEWRVTISGENVTVSHNGEEVPASRIRRTKDAVQVLDKNGEVVKKFGIGAGGGMVFVGPGGEAGAWRTLKGLQGQGFPALGGHAELIQMDPPKVMVGVRMNDENGRVVVEDVIEGLPAEKAGIKPGDILVSVGGHDIEASTDVREALKDHEPGDAIDFTIERDGKEQKITVRLAAYDAEKVGAPMTLKLDEPGQGHAWWTRSDEDRWVAEAKKHVEAAIEQIKKSDALNSDKMKATVEKTMREALRALEQAGQQTDQFMRQFNFGGDRPRVVLTPRGDQRFVVPGGGAGASQDDVERKLDRLTQQLDRLADRLDSLQERLEKLDKDR